VRQPLNLLLQLLSLRARLLRLGASLHQQWPNLFPRLRPLPGALLVPNHLLLPLMLLCRRMCWRIVAIRLLLIPARPRKSKFLISPVRGERLAKFPMRPDLHPTMYVSCVTMRVLLQ
jgi:hypothetical protein